MNVPALQQFLAHGHRDVPPAPTSGLVDVVFHDDDFTPIELVKGSWAQVPAPAGRVEQRIHTAHDEGEVVVATLRADDAILRADETRLARGTSGSRSASRCAPPASAARCRGSSWSRPGSAGPSRASRVAARQ